MCVMLRGRRVLAMHVIALAVTTLAAAHLLTRLVSTVAERVRPLEARDHQKLVPHEEALEAAAKADENDVAWFVQVRQRLECQTYH